MPAEINYPYRTRDGRKARIVATDFQHALYPVLAFILQPTGLEITQSYTPNLKVAGAAKTDTWDLFEYNPWNDIAVDTPIWVNEIDGGWVPRHFAGVVPESQQVLVYRHGRTSHTTSEHGPSMYSSGRVSLTDPTKTKEN